MMRKLYFMLLAGFALMATVSCSEEIIDEVIEEPVPEVITVKEPTKIHVSVGAGLPQTKSTVDYNSTTGQRTLKFTTGDKLYVYREVAEDVNLAGELTMVGEPTNEGMSATFSGELKVYNDAGTETCYDFGATDPLTGSTAYLLHAGILEGLYTKGADQSLKPVTEEMVAGDVATLMTSALVVTGQYSGTGYSLSAASMPIMNCSIIGLASGTYHVALGYANSEEDYNTDYVAEITTYYQTFTTDDKGAVSFAFATEWTDSGYYVLMLSTDGNFYQNSPDMLTCIIGQRSKFETKVYNINRMKSGSTFVKYVNLTGKTGDVTLNDGDIVNGTLSGHQLLIADGATVTLSGVSVTAPEGSNYGAIRCLGDATIILADGTTNTAKSGYGNYYAAVSVPENKTLTINGGALGTAGTLKADAKVDGESICRAGIGGGQTISCGKITITGGTVTAYGSNHAAGIGGGWDAYFDDITITGGTVTATGGQNSDSNGGGAGIGCHAAASGYVGNGSITISGGTVTATGGGYAAGIGTGGHGKCGSITIGSGISSVTATKGSYGYDIRCIGKGKQGTVGTVTIDGQMIYDWMGLDEAAAYDAHQAGYLSDDDYANWLETQGAVLTFSHLNFDATSQTTWTLTKKTN